MAPTVQNILEVIESLAPEDLTEPWDNTGLMIGDPASHVNGILLGLDPTIPLLDEAQSIGANLIITHHPIIFHPLKSIHLDHPDGRFINTAIRNQINVISSHTNLDSARHGISDVLARQLGLNNIAPLVPQGTEEAGYGLGRIGSYNEPVPAAKFIDLIKSACNPPWLLSAGNMPDTVSKVAVCGGSCSDLAGKAQLAGVDVFVTAEVKHNIARWAEDAGFWIIDAGHFATENTGIQHFAGQLAKETASRFEKINIKVTGSQSSPLTLM